MQAGQVKRADDKKAFHLQGSDRFEWLTPRQAMARNSAQALVGIRRWVECPEVDADQVIERPVPPSGKNRTLAIQEGNRLDNEWMALRARNGRESVMDKVEATKAAKKSEKSKSTEDGGGEAGGKSHQEWKGHGMCALLRWCGKQNFDKDQATAALLSVGLTPNPATVSIQLRKGRNDESVPTMTKNDANELRKALGGAKPAGGAKKAKADAPAGEKKGSKGDAKEGAVKTSKKNGGNKKKPKAEEPAGDADEEELSDEAAAELAAEGATDEE